MTSTGYQVVLTDRSLREICTDLVTQAGPWGITVAEALTRIPDRHHGHVSGVFSKQHERGNFAQLTEKREGYHIYLLPEHVYDRPTEAQGTGRPSKAEIEWLQRMESRLEYWFEVTQDGSQFGTDRQRVDRPGNRPLFVDEMRKIWAERP